MTAFLVLPSLVPAQSGPEGDQRVMHLWVDPHYGDDSLAMAFNVTLSNPLVCVALQQAPTDVLNTSGDVLLHQPYPFKTITGAVAYINSLPPTVSATDPLPHRSSLTPFRWEYAIIHLLPGRYATSNAASPSTHNQLEANGETFPIELPNRVSIQGTSALDTVIEVSFEDHVPAFRFGKTAGTRGEHCFISTVSIMGAGPDAFGSPKDSFTAAAIALEGIHSSELRIDNCFLFSNGIGILADNLDDQEEAAHEVYVLNCTFVWNGVAIWNGEASRHYNEAPCVGRSKFLLVNNIFDTAPPTPITLLTGPSCSGGGNRPFPSRWVTAANLISSWSGRFTQPPPAPSAFEGIQQADLETLVSGGTSDFNAYEGVPQGFPVRFDHQRSVEPLDLAATMPSGTRPSGPEPDLNIGMITGASPHPQTNSPGTRGVLFVADLFRAGYDPRQLQNPAWLGMSTAVGCNFDLSPMDFRLSPVVTEATRVQGGDPPAPLVPGTQGVPNPLVDRGFGHFPISQANGLTLSAPPRARVLAGSQDTWPFDDWTDYDDCEGFGNRRLFDHPEYREGDPAPEAPIDIGADELDLLIVAGYRYGTRTFTRTLDTSTQPDTRIDNVYLWTLGLPDNMSSKSPEGWGLCASTNWWVTPAPEKYEPYLSSPWPEWVPGSPPTGVYYKPLVADITPHLLPDWHPYHTVTIDALWPSNPVWQDCAGPPLQPIHNPFLYVDPTFPLANPSGVYPTAVVNPPGFTFAWIEGAPSPYSGHTLAAAAYPLGFWRLGAPSLGGPSDMMSFGAWCQNRLDSGSFVYEAHIFADSVPLPGGSSQNTWNSVYPHQQPPTGGFPPGESLEFRLRAAQRITVELPRWVNTRGKDASLFDFEGPSNIQTFMIWRQPEAGGSQ